MFTEIKNGFASPFRGLAFILQDRGLLALAAAPVIIATALYVAGGYWFATRFAPWFDALWAPATASGFWAGAGSVLRAIVYYSAYGLAVVAAAITFFVAVNLISAPFFESLAERAESLWRNGGPSPSQPWLRAITMQIRKLLAFGILYLVGLVFNLIPGVGVVASIGLTFLFVSDQFLDFTLARHGFSLRRRLAFIWRAKFRMAGFVAAAMLALAVPPLAIIMAPACVVGAVRVFLDYESR